MNEFIQVGSYTFRRSAIVAITLGKVWLAGCPNGFPLNHEEQQQLRDALKKPLRIRNL